MKVIKKILLIIFALIVFTVIGVIGYFWPIDSRLDGTFKSDKEATIRYLKTIRNPTEKQLNIWNQMYGHLYYIFDGHKINLYMEPHVVSNFWESGSAFPIYEDKDKSYFFMRRSEIGEDRVELIILPSPLWDLESTRLLEVEFDKNGFWIIVNSWNVVSGFKEKFTKIKS